jgi:hypothetical protein
LFDRKCQIFCYPHYKFNKWHMHFLMQYHPRDFVPADGGGTSSHLDTCLRGRKKTISSLLSLQEAILSLVNTKILSIRWRSDNWSSSRKWVSYCSRMQEGYDPDDIPPVKMGYPLSYGFRREKSHSHPDGTF